MDGPSSGLAATFSLKGEGLQQEVPSGVGRRPSPFRERVPARAGEGLLFVLILFIGTFLRFHALDRQSLWDDEMSTVHTITVPRSQIIHRFKTYETHPPLYFLQLRLWRALGGRSLVRLRANSAVWGSIGLVAIFALARLYYGSIGGLLAMGLLAFSPFHLAYSQEARPYALGITLGIVSLWVLENALRTGKFWYYVLLAMSWTALLYTHYWGAFVVGAQALYGFLQCHPPRFLAGDPWIAPQRPGGMTRIVICAAVASALFAFWLPVFAAQLGIVNGLTFWVPLFSPANLVKTLAAFTGLYFNMASSVFYLHTTVGFMVLFGIVFLNALILGLWKGPLSAKLWLVVGLMVPWLLSLWKISIYVWYRYPILILPAFILLITAGLRSPKSPWLRGALSAILLASQIWACHTYFTTWQKANPKAVVQYVHWLRKPNTVVVRPPYFADLFNFYDQGTLPSIDQNQLDSPEKRARLKGKDIILLAFDVPSDPVTEAFLAEFHPLTGRYFPGFAHLGITVYRLK